MMTETLNPEQRCAALAGLNCGATLSGPAVWVNAGAGTGKTATLVARIVALLRAGLPPERLLVLTFSRRAAGEMVRRAGPAMAQQAQGSNAGSRSRLTLPWAGTFHSVAARLLRQDARALGLNPAFTVLDRSDALELLGVIRERQLAGERRRRVASAATMLSVMSDCINTDASVPEVLARRFPWCVTDASLMSAVFEAFAAAKAEQALLDYDDLLQWVVLGLREPAIAMAWRSHFDAAVIDEAQDCNPLQWQMLRGLLPAGRGAFLVGDTAQSIYGFRGASPADLHAYVRDTNAQTHALGRNYRSSQPVLDLANALLAEADEPCGVSLVAATCHGGELPRLVATHDEPAQADYIIDQVLAARETGVALHEQAVLFRSSHHSDTLEIALARANIPFVKHGGLRFIDAAHVRDALALARWALNPANNLAASRSLQMLPGIGPAHVRRMLASFDACGPDGFTALAKLPSPVAAREPLGQLSEHLTAMAGSGRGLVAFEALLDWLSALIHERYDNGQTRMADLEMLLAAARRAGSVRAMLTQLALDPPQAAGDLGERAHLDEDQLILSTVHSAKGQEWRNVFILNVTDGNFPNEYATSDAAALAEERRLLYVAMTRARRELHLIEPRCHYVTAQPALGGRHVTGARSRFLTEPVLARLTACTWPWAEPERATATTPAEEPSANSTLPQQGSIADQLVSRWRVSAGH